MKTGFYKKTLFENIRGNTPIIIICSTLFVIIISAALTDIGFYAVQRFKLERDVEAVVGYGAEELAKGSINAEALIEDYAKKRDSELNKLDIRIPDNRKEITVTMGKQFNYNFLKLIGLSKKDIEANSTARLSVVRAFKGIRPFAVQEHKFEYQKLYTLTYGSHENGTTAFLPLDLGEGYKVAIKYGSRKKVNVGDKVTSLKNVDGKDALDGIKSLIEGCRHEPVCTYKEHAEDCQRIIILPIVDKLQSGDLSMKVTGFAAFFVENIEDGKEHPIIKGRFIKHAVQADTTDNIRNFGLTGIKMLN